MSRAYFNDSRDLEWRQSLRHAALNAPTGGHGSRRWIWGIAGAFCVLFAGMLWLAPERTFLTAPGVRGAVDQAAQLHPGGVTGQGLFPMAYPLWLLAVSRLTDDLTVAARLLSGLAAVLVLFLAYQLSHVLAQKDKASEQACFALIALALSPTFFRAASGGGTEVPHLALLLGSLWFMQRAIGGTRPFAAMAVAGLLSGLSLLLRPISVVIPIAVVIWIWQTEPFRDDERRAINLRAGLGFVAAFAVGVAPLLIMHVLQGTPLSTWGMAEVGMFVGRLAADPLATLLGSVVAMVQYVLADDLERVAAIGSFWTYGYWGHFLGAIVALGPTLVEAFGAAAIISLLWRARFDSLLDRSSLPSLVMLVAVALAALGLVGERSPLLLHVLFTIFAFAGLTALFPGSAGGFVGLGLVGLLVFNQFGAVYSGDLTSTYLASREASTQLRLSGATPDRVMSSSWAYYDATYPWRERYSTIPLHVGTLDGLVREMRRQGATHLLLDRHSSASYWPRLLPLLESPEGRSGLRPLRDLIRTEDFTPNWVGVYRLD